jgi:hypothetical protein
MYRSKSRGRGLAFSTPMWSTSSDPGLSMMEKISKTPNLKGKAEVKHRSEQKMGSPSGEDRKKPDLS